MNLLARRDPSVPLRTIQESKIRWLGEPVSGYQYGEHKGTEYAVDVRPAEVESFVPQAGEMLVSRKHTELIDGRTPWETVTLYRAWPVKAGTYAELVGKARKPATEPSLRAWDRLAALPLMQRREPMRLATGPASSVMDQLVTLPSTSEQEQQALAGAVDMARANRSRSLIEVGGNEPPERSVAGMVAYLARQGIELSLARGRLRARSAKPIRADLQVLLDQAEELIVGHLQGKPVICGDCAEPAVTIVSVNAPVCDEHAQ